MKEKALHEKAKRELAEIQLAQKRREMHDAADVEAVLTEILVNFRNQIRGIPAEMAPLRFGESRPERAAGRGGAGRGGKDYAEKGWCCYSY